MRPSDIDVIQHLADLVAQELSTLGLISDPLAISLLHRETPSGESWHLQWDSDTIEIPLSMAFTDGLGTIGTSPAEARRSLQLLMLCC